jgi:hypothetical protein
MNSTLTRQPSIPSVQTSDRPAPRSMPRPLSRPARLRRTIFGLVGLMACTATMTIAPAAASAAPTTPAAARAPRTLDCRYLSGAGTYSNPKWIGSITDVTYVVNCPPLRSGAGYNVVYFSFSMPRTPSSGSAVMTYYQRGTGSGIHPRLAWGATTVRGSLAAYYYLDSTYEGFYHSMGGLSAGTWRLGAEKLSSPLGSTVTAWYNILLVP